MWKRVTLSIKRHFPTKYDIFYYKEGQVGIQESVIVSNRLLTDCDTFTDVAVTDTICIKFKSLYRVTIQVGPNLPLTSKQKFRFGLTRPG